MSVNKTVYCVYGFKMPYIEGCYDNDKLLPYIEGHVGIEYAYIVDGMCGEYSVFGKVLGKSSEYDENEFTEVDITKIDPEATKNKYQELFGDIPEEPKVLFFSHYS